MVLGNSKREQPEIKITQKNPPDPTAVGPGGQNTNNAKKAPPRPHRTSEVQRELGGANSSERN